MTTKRTVPNPTPPAQIALPPLGSELQGGTRVPTDDLSETWVEFDADMHALACSDSYALCLALPRGSIIGRTPFEYAPRLTRTLFFPRLKACLASRKRTSVVGFSTIMNHLVVVRTSPLAHGGIHVRGTVASEDDVTRHNLAHQQFVDRLTGLPTERSLMSALEHRLETGETFHLLLLGLSRFKAVNELGGSCKGDHVLMEMAARLHSTSNPGDQVYRLNGDLFPVLLSAGPTPVAERIRKLKACLTRPVQLRGRDFVLGCRGGIVSAPDDGHTPELLMKRVVLALKRAKGGSHVNLVAYRARFEAESEHRAALEHSLRLAVGMHQLVLHFQPIAGLPDRRIIGAEALLRWNHPESGLMAPQEFLPLAHDLGLMPAIDRFVLGSAVEHIQSLRRARLSLPLCINISVDSLTDTTFLTFLRRTLATARIRPGELDIEVPEGTLMADIGAHAKALAKLRSLGVALSIDDFGTGYSSFAYLARLPVSTLKIDRAFIQDMGGPSGKTVVSGMIALAHALALRVVAEGAETSAQLRLLAAMGCEAVQGFIYARPMPFNQLCRFAEDSLAAPAAA
ncbi:MAG: bifunctional diguanylate cyclase/phosphodiesterase [Burkholderiaceae bacterium]|jgi:diguanylate cyclase (GGDEF)-like protein